MSNTLNKQEVLGKYSTDKAEVITSLDMSAQDVVLALSGGNPGTMTVLAGILNKDPMMGLMKLLTLDGRGIHGSDIWELYKKECGEDIDTLYNLL